MDWPQILKGRDTFVIKTKPSKPKTRITAEEDGVLVVEVGAPAVGNKANDEIERFFSKLLRKKILITRGKTSKRKQLKSL